MSDAQGKTSKFDAENSSIQLHTGWLSMLWLRAHHTKPSTLILKVNDVAALYSTSMSFFLDLDPLVSFEF